MLDALTILGAIILGVAGNALWDLCKTVYRKRNDDKLILLNLFKRDQIQTLGLSTPSKKIQLRRRDTNIGIPNKELKLDRIALGGFSHLSNYKQCARRYFSRQALLKKI